MEVRAGPAPEKWYPLEVGSTVRGESDQRFYTLRYEFKPASIDWSKPGTLHKGIENDVTVRFDNSQAGKPRFEFEGSHEYGKDNDAIIFFDGERFRIDKLARAVKTLRHVRNAEPATALQRTGGSLGEDGEKLSPIPISGAPSATAQVEVITPEAALGGGSPEPEPVPVKGRKGKGTKSVGPGDGNSEGKAKGPKGGAKDANGGNVATTKGKQPRKRKADELVKPVIIEEVVKPPSESGDDEDVEVLDEELIIESGDEEEVAPFVVLDAQTSVPVKAADEASSSSGSSGSDSGSDSDSDGDEEDKDDSSSDDD